MTDGEILEVLERAGHSTACYHTSDWELVCICGLDKAKTELRDRRAGISPNAPRK